MKAAAPPRVLTIAGSDSGGGAGIQADLKTFAAHGVYGMSVVTAVTAQNTVAVTGVHAVPAALVVDQIDAVFSDIGVDAVKIGMLANAEIVRSVAHCLRRYEGPPIVLDPVMVAKSGDSLLEPQAAGALTEELLPRARVITPNLPEAERLAGRRAGTLDERIELARELALLGPAVLLKGGHASGPEVIDILCSGKAVEQFAHPRMSTSATHGTGCTLSSALAARLSRGETLRSAAAGAIRYLQEAMAAAYPLGAGHGPVNHLYRYEGVLE
jgi:hydroxymethylpyrimidine/phosphomethylpyrimidine kinase